MSLFLLNGILPFSFLGGSFSGNIFGRYFYIESSFRYEIGRQVVCSSIINLVSIEFGVCNHSILVSDILVCI